MDSFKYCFNRISNVILIVEEKETQNLLWKQNKNKARNLSSPNKNYRIILKHENNLSKQSKPKQVVIIMKSFHRKANVCLVKYEELIHILKWGEKLY